MRRGSAGRPSRELAPTRGRRIVGHRAVDERAVDAAVPRLRALYVAKTLEAAEAVGRFLLESFYGGEVAHWRTLGTAHASMQALSRRSGLGMSGSHLWRCLRLVEQLESMDGSVGRRLSVTHHRLLYKVEDEGLKGRLAAEAVAEGWDTGELERRVSRAVGPAAPGRPGRRPDAPLEALVKRVEKATRDLELQEIDAGFMAGMDARRQARFVGRLAAQAAKLAALVQRLDPEG